MNEIKMKEKKEELEYHAEYNRRLYWGKKLKELGIDRDYSLDSRQLKDQYLKAKAEQRLNDDKGNLAETVSANDSKLNVDTEDKASGKTYQKSMYDYFDKGNSEVDEEAIDEDNEEYLENIESFYKALRDKRLDGLSSSAKQEIQRGISPLLYGRSPRQGKPVHMLLEDFIEYLELKRELEKAKERKKDKSHWGGLRHMGKN